MSFKVFPNPSHPRALCLQAGSVFSAGESLDATFPCPARRATEQSLFSGIINFPQKLPWQEIPRGRTYLQYYFPISQFHSAKCNFISSDINAKQD